MAVLHGHLYLNQGVFVKSRRKDNWGYGGFSDQYDNGRLRSLDHDQRPGGVTGIPFDDDFDIETNDYFPDHGEKRIKTRGFYHYGGSKPSRPIYQGIGPKGWKRSDERIKEDVCHVLEQSYEVDASGLEVEVQDGCVSLKGEIESVGMRRVAEDLVGSVPGVVDVFCQLRIT